MPVVLVGARIDINVIINLQVLCLVKKDQRCKIVTCNVPSKSFYCSPNLSLTAVLVRVLVAVTNMIVYVMVRCDTLNVGFLFTFSIASMFVFVSIFLVDWNLKSFGFRKMSGVAKDDAPVTRREEGNLICGSSFTRLSLTGSSLSIVFAKIYKLERQSYQQFLIRRIYNGIRLVEGLAATITPTEVDKYPNRRRDITMLQSNLRKLTTRAISHWSDTTRLSSDNECSCHDDWSCFSMMAFLKKK